MTSIKYSNEKKIDFEKIFALYQDAGWTAYTAKPAVLEKAIQESLYILSAWNGQELVGFLRAVGDGQTIIYIQDIIVLKKYQRQGIGKALLEQALKKYENVRQIMLLTDEQANTISFYESVGMQQTNKLNLVSFIRINP